MRVGDIRQLILVIAGVVEYAHDVGAKVQVIRDHYAYLDTLMHQAAYTDDEHATMARRLIASLGADNYDHLLRYVATCAPNAPRPIPS